MIDFGNQPRENGAAVKITVATVAAVTEDGVTLVIPPSTVATQKPARRLAAAEGLREGDAVLCVKTSGSWVVLDKIV